MRLGGNADYFSVIRHEEDIVNAANFSKENKLGLLALGGGSNIIVKDVLSPKIVLKMENKGIEVIKKRGEVLVKVSAGEVWDDFVDFCVQNNFSGIEALSMIPGTVGATPIQNVGAYGAEVSQTIKSVRFYNIEKGEFQEIQSENCKFLYRDSIFKKELKNKAIIESVVFSLGIGSPKIPDYPSVSETLKLITSENSEESLIKRISLTIRKIRSEKLPDPKQIPNSGSFFKNVEIDDSYFTDLAKKFPDIKYFKTDKGYKIPTGYLIEKAGFKGLRSGGVGIYDKNALILVNYSSNQTDELLDFAREIQEKVKDIFGLEIEIEPEIIT